MTKVNISPQAIEDLKEIQEYITNDLCNKTAAQNVISNIIKSIRSLEKFPDIGSHLYAKINFPTDYRTLISGNYITFYRVSDGEVYVSRVLYGGRNYVRILFGEISYDK